MYRSNFCPAASQLSPWKKILSLALLCIGFTLSAAPKIVGETAKDFELISLKGAPRHLSSLTAKGPVVLLVLRGFPGYQCPLCNRQVKEFVSHANEFPGATVLIVYPGPGDGLGKKAKEFATDKNLPKSFEMVLDPDYTFTSNTICAGMRLKKRLNPRHS